MKIISLFNNKGGVGKTTLAFHLSWILSEMGKKVLMIDLDPQCNLTLFGLDEHQIEQIWNEEDDFIEDFDQARQRLTPEKMREFNKKHHSIHYILKPTEDGYDDFLDEDLSAPIMLNTCLGLIPGRLTTNRYENVISERWSQAYRGVSLAIRTLTRIRTIAEAYSQRDGYDFIIIDTSPSLGILNKVIISTVDGFIIPCLPDMFSLYGIKNIGNSLSSWKSEFNTIYDLISNEKRQRFPQHFVQFLGYTIYNAKKYSRQDNRLNLATAHYNYAIQIPRTIEDNVAIEVRNHLTSDMLHNPIGGVSVMHTHNTLPAIAQKYKIPMWKIPDCPNLDSDDRRTVSPNRETIYLPTRDAYKIFAEDFLRRVETLDR